MNHYSIIKKLIGDIKPIGQTHIDADKYTNLVNMCEMVELLIEDIIDVSKLKDRTEHSIKVAGERADIFLKSIRHRLDQ